MLSETSLIDCQNLPGVMRAQLDRPWKFLGEVNPRDDWPDPWMRTCCTSQHCLPECVLTLDLSEYPVERYSIVHLDGHHFIDADMLEITIFFGTCNECQAVYWARQGPPFKRARYLRPAAV